VWGHGGGPATGGTTLAPYHRGVNTVTASRHKAAATSFFSATKPAYVA
jgi:hypothetical protein